MRRTTAGEFMRGVVAAACLVAATVLGEARAHEGVAESSRAQAAVPQGAVAITVSSPAVLPREAPIAVAYAGSPRLTRMLRVALAAEGLHMGDAMDPAAAVARVRGVLQLTGKHTARIPIAALAEQATALDPANTPRALALANVGYVIAAGHWLGHLTRAGELGAPAGGLLFIDIVGQATGAKDWFNRAIGGDRRGVCLVNCADWHKTRQAALQVVELETATGRRRMTVKAELLAEALQPGAVVSAGLAALVAVLSGRDPPGATEPDTRDGATPN